MNFLNLELCKELQSAGIVNESGFVWSVYKTPICDIDPRFANMMDPNNVPAYVAEIAFLGPGENANMNAIWWFGSLYWRERRDELNNLDTTKESVEDFLRRTREK